MTFACLIPATASASLGKTTVGDLTGQPGDGTPGSAQDWQAVAVTSETVNRLSVYLLTGTTGDPELALYDANQTKLASCTITVVDADAWHSCAIPGVPITAGSTYWLALVRPQGQGKIVFSGSSGGSASFASDSTHLLAALPTWVDGAADAPQTASLYADDSTGPPPPPPPPGGSEPAPIAGQGYHEVFRDDFKTLDRTVWDYCVWYDCLAPEDQPTWASTRQEVDANGMLHLKARAPYEYLNTITTQTSGKTWKYGYFEARMKWPPGHGSWPGFWLYSYRHATNPSWPSINPLCAQLGEPASHCWSGEIDAFEGQGSEPNVFYGTIHQNSSGGYGAADQQNDPNAIDAGVDLTAGFHTYAMLWTATSIKWFLDGQEVLTATPYESLNQPMFLLLQEWTGGWTFNPDGTTPGTLDNQIDYVDVWQQ